MESILIIVLKIGPVIDSARSLGHWFIGRAIESMVEPHNLTKLTRMTRIYNSVYIQNYIGIKLY